MCVTDVIIQTIGALNMIMCVTDAIIQTIGALNMISVVIVVCRTDS